MRVPMTTLDYLDRALDLYADRVGVVTHEGQEYSYEEFGRRVNRVSHALLDRGLEPGDRVGLVAPNTHYFLEILYATNQLGMVFVPVNYRLTSDDYQYIFNDCGLEALVVDYDYADVVNPIRDSTPVNHWIAYRADRCRGDWEDYETILKDASPESPQRPSIQEDDDATINYTSGTTGEPKGVVRTYRNEHYHALLLMHHMEIQDDDNYLWTLPMFHCNGWGHTYAITGVGGTHVCQRTFDPEMTFRRIETHDVSYLCAAPTLLNRLVSYRNENNVDVPGTGDLRVTTAGSAPASGTIRKIEDEFGWELIHLYGLTETAPLITTSNSPRRLQDGDRFAIKPRQGFEVLNTELRVVDEDGNNVPRDGETLGEVVVRGNQVFDRYLNKPEATETSFNERIGGYFHTGDLATMDEHGMISILDRKKDIIISGGENISTIEVEDVLYDHPDVAKASVVAAPSEEWGETPVAVVVPESGTEPGEQEIIDHTRDQLAHYMCPTRVDFVEDLPETATGKVQKHKLRNRYWEGEESRVGQQ